MNGERWIVYQARDGWQIWIVANGTRRWVFFNWHQAVTFAHRKAAKHARKATR